MGKFTDNPSRLFGTLICILIPLIGACCAFYLMYMNGKNKKELAIIALGSIGIYLCARYYLWALRLKPIPDMFHGLLSVSLGMGVLAFSWIALDIVA